MSPRNITALTAATSDPLMTERYRSNDISSQISSGDILIDLSSRNVSQWLLKTRPEYYKRRYGGFEFGVRNPLADLDFNYLQDIFSTLDKATNLGESRLNFFEKEVVSARISQNFSFGFHISSQIELFQELRSKNMRRIILTMSAFGSTTRAGQQVWLT